MIDILIPVLGRPHNAAPLVENIRACTEVPVTITFLSSPSDLAQIEAVGELASASIWEETPIQQWVVPWDPGHGDFSKKINAGFQTTESEWLFMAADDIRFEPKWDYHALRAANGGPGYDVIGTNDLANSSVRRGLFGTHCLIRRRYVTERGGTVDGGAGTVLHEGYDHNFVDRELCHTAQQRGVFTFAKHCRVRHYHPLWRTAPNDATYVKSLKHFRADQQLFLSRAHLWEHVGLSAGERKMAA